MPHVCLEPSSSFSSLSDEKQKCIPGPVRICASLTRIHPLPFVPPTLTPVPKCEHAKNTLKLVLLYLLLLLGRYIDHLSQISAPVFRSMLHCCLQRLFLTTQYKLPVLPLLHPTPPHVPFPLHLLSSQLLPQPAGGVSLFSCL